MIEQGEDESRDFTVVVPVFDDLRTFARPAELSLHRDVLVAFEVISENM